MCRFLAYTGTPVLLSDLLYRPSHSLIRQSHCAREMDESLNGDGYGIGWYVPDVDPTPCVQRSVLPAWASLNMQNLAAKTRASHVFAHVRAASSGMHVMEANVHPFSYDRFMWMHNGGVAGFHHIRRKLRASLKDEFDDMIQGTTDSEHCFALFLNNLRVPFGEAGGDDLRRALVEMIAQLNDWSREANIVEPSFYNFAVTDGSSIVVSRYCSAAGIKGRSLYYSRGFGFDPSPAATIDAAVRTNSATKNPTNEKQYAHVIVASESLTDNAADWTEVPDNHTVTVGANLSVELSEIKSLMLSESVIA